MTDPITIPAEEEEALALPSFEILVRNGEPIVSGSYFLHPPLRAVHAGWDPADPSHLLVRADDGSDWHAVDVPRTGRVNVVLEPVGGEHPSLAQARAVQELAAETK
jgi:hypothetical protein